MRIAPANNAKHHKYYFTTLITTSTTNDYKHHNHNINLLVENLIKRCQTKNQFYQLQAHFITSGLFRHPFPASHILKLSSHLSIHIDHTLLIFQHIRLPDTFCINTVLRAYSSSSLSHLVAPLYFNLLSKCAFRPNSFTFPPLLISCANSLSTHVGLICHSHAIKFGYHNVVPVHNSLIHMYASFGLIHSASRLFDSMSNRDSVSWNSIINGYVRVGDVDTAHRIFDQMPMKNVVSWNIMISGYLNKARNPGCGLKLFREMIKMGIRGTDTTFVVVLTACGRSARLKEGKSVHGSMIKNVGKSSLIIKTALIDMYSKCRRVDAARRVFDSMLVRNIVCWNAMILGYCIHGCPDDGISLFHEMTGRMHCDDYSGGRKERKRSKATEQLVIPDEITFIGVLCACARGGLLSDGRSYFNQMSSVYNLKPKFAHYWCMANLYFGAGLVQEAEEVLRSMPGDEDDSSESSVWSSLLGSCRFRGDIELGERIAVHLIELEPQNSSHYSLLLNIYAVAGRWEEAAKVKTVMEENGMVKALGCSLVDLNEVVHEFTVGDISRPGMDVVYTMLGELVRKLRLSTSGFTATIANSWK